MKIVVAGAALGSLLGLAACGGEPTATTGRDVRERWHVAQPGHANARPAVAGGLVYFGTGDGQVIARDQRTGAVRWSTPVTADGRRVEGGNLIARGGVVVAPVVRHVAGVDAVTGQKLWQYAPPADTVDDPAPRPGQVVQAVLDADDGAVYVPAWGASVSAVDLTTGAARWVWTPGRSAGDTAASGVFRSGAEGVAVSGDTVFVGAWHSLDRRGLRSEPWLVALDRRTGREFWRVVLPSYTGGVLLSGAPAVAGPLVLLGTIGGHVWAVDRATQRVAWHHVPQATGATVSGVQLAGGVAYVDGGDTRLYALDAATGAVRWSAPAGYAAAAELLVTPRRVYYPRQLDVQVFDRATGRRVAEAALPGGVTEQSLVASPAAHAGGQVFITVNGAAWSFDEP